MTTIKVNKFPGVMKAHGWAISPYFVYCIENTEGILYAGLTNSLVRRLREHRAGKTHSTAKGCLKWELQWFWNCPDYVSASKLERILHTCSKEQKIQLIQEHPKLDDYLQSWMDKLPTIYLETLESDQQRSFWMQYKKDPIAAGIR